MHTATELERRVQFVLATAELVLERPIRSVLDACCGEGAWMPVLTRLRPRVRYVGIDASEYAVRRFGTSRGIRLGCFRDLDELAAEGPFDLVVCSGALYYLDTAEIAAGLAAIGELLEGVAFLEVFTEADPLEGDVRGVRRRRASWWRAAMRRAGLAPLGMHCWVTAERAAELAEMERRPR